MFGRFIAPNVVKAVAAALIIALLVTIFNPPMVALAQAKRETEPGDFFFLELLAGLGGAYIGGVAGAWGIKTFLGREGKEVNEETVTVAVLTLTGLGIGIAAGATLGVVLAGWLCGVNGNLIFAPLGSSFGVINSFGLIYLFEIQEERELDPTARTILLTVIPAFGATVGYNVGAKMRAKGTSEGAGIAVGTKTEFTISLFKIGF